MSDTPLGISFNESMSGGFALGVSDPAQAASQGNAANTVLTMKATVTIHNLSAFISDPNHLGSLVGTIDFAPLGVGLPSTKGVFNLFAPAGDPLTKYMVYELGFSAGGKDYYLAGRKELRDDPGLDVWSDTTTLLTRLHAGSDSSGPVVGAGVLNLSIKQLLQLIPTMTVLNATSTKDKLWALGRFGAFFGINVYETFVKQQAPKTAQAAGGAAAPAPAPDKN